MLTLRAYARLGFDVEALGGTLEHRGGRQRDAFVRLVRAVAFLGGRPPSRPFAREARAFASLRFAPTRAAALTMLSRVFPRTDTRATRTRAPGRLAGCTFRYSASTARMARSAFACESAAAYTHISEGQEHNAMDTIPQEFAATLWSFLLEPHR